ncbi:hypothetical protein MN116_000461, partial [Schistosoma mekongi]
DDNLHPELSTTTLKLQTKTTERGKKTLICYSSAGTDRSIVPKSYQRIIFNTLHNVSHPGVRATSKLTAQRFCRPKMNKDIKGRACSCMACQKNKVIQHNKCPLGTFPTPDARFDHVHLDLVEPLPEPNGFSYPLTFVDRFTRWPKEISLKNITSETIA